MSEKRILIIENDDDVVAALRNEIEAFGFQLDYAGNGELGLEMALEGKYELILLELKLRRLNGLEVLRRLRERAKALPILILSSQSHESDIILGLELGADEYLTKPFSPRELCARIRSMLRRVEAYRTQFSSAENAILEFGQLHIDLMNQTVTLDGKVLTLTKTEYHLLRCLSTRAGRVFTREELIQEVFGYSISVYRRSINPHISRLRSKIEPDPTNPTYLRTIRGLGYRFVRSEEL
ncbi:MAG: response regulator transcription factor [Bdellovibrionales bacterium]|nr:response regulator transcription factor [Bdellovibrionales bacterium]